MKTFSKKADENVTQVPNAGRATAACSSSSRRRRRRAAAAAAAAAAVTAWNLFTNL
jgi:hypothetical protein